MITFLNPIMLWALPVVAAPVLLHWLRRSDRLPVIPFGGAYILKRIMAEHPHRQRWHDLWLMILRMLLLLAVVAGVARPAWVARDELGMKNERFARGRIVFPDKEGGGLTVAQVGARLTGIQSGNARVEPAPYYHPALDGVDLGGVTASRWWQIEPVGRSLVLARFDNGDPFLVEHDRGDGYAVLLCAVPLDLDWSDLILDAGYVALTNRVTRYLEAQPKTEIGGPVSGSHRDIGWLVLTVGLLLGAAEMAWGGGGWWKLAGGVMLAVLIMRPQFDWPWMGSAAENLAVIVDETGSMQFTGDVVEGIAKRIKGGRVSKLTGAETDLGGALQALTNQVVGKVVLISDGQHNAGIMPGWVAARLGMPVVAVGVDPLASSGDVMLTRLNAPVMLWPGETMWVEVNIKVTGLTLTNVTLEIADQEGAVLRTNVAPGRVVLPVRNHEPPPGLRQYELRVLPSPGEVTTANNTRVFQVARHADPIRVRMESEKVDWEFRHVLHAMRRDPSVAIVTDGSKADVVVKTDGETWRMRRHGHEAFQKYWSRRVRWEWIEHHRPVMPKQIPVREELYQLWCQEQTLKEVARVSGGAYFTERDTDKIGEELKRVSVGVANRFDLRESWLVLLMLVGCWAMGWVTRKSR